MGNNTALCATKNSRFTDASISTQDTSTSLHKLNAKTKEISKNNFKILKVIGRGSFGKVFLV
jgi:hypothetical protein